MFIAASMANRQHFLTMFKKCFRGPLKYVVHSRNDVVMHYLPEKWYATVCFHLDVIPPSINTRACVANPAAALGFDDVTVGYPVKVGHKCTFGNRVISQNE